MKLTNYICYYGNREQLEAFAIELEKVGFTRGNNEWNERITNILTYQNLFTKGDKVYDIYNHGGLDNPLRFTSDQFAEALAAATKPAE